MKKILPKEVFSDERGRIETISAGPAWKEVNRFTSMAGVTRGGHYHKTTNEILFVLSGHIEITCKNIKSGSKNTMEIKEDEGILIEPWELHTVKIIKNSEWISLLSQVYDKNQPDTHEIK